MAIALEFEEDYSVPIFPKNEFEIKPIGSGNIGYKIINKGYDNYPHKNVFKWMIKLSLFRDYRLDFDKYNEAFDKIELKLINSKLFYHLVCRYNKEDRQEVLFYSDNSFIDENFYKPLLSELKDPNKIKLEIVEDENWSLVSDIIE